MPEPPPYRHQLGRFNPCREKELCGHVELISWWDRLSVTANSVHVMWLGSQNIPAEIQALVDWVYFGQHVEPVAECQLLVYFAHPPTNRLFCYKRDKATGENLAKVWENTLGPQDAVLADFVGAPGVVTGGEAFRSHRGLVCNTIRSPHGGLSVDLEVLQVRDVYTGGILGEGVSEGNSVYLVTASGGLFHETSDVKAIDQTTVAAIWRGNRTTRTHHWRVAQLDALRLEDEQGDLYEPQPGLKYWNAIDNVGQVAAIDYNTDVYLTTNQMWGDQRYRHNIVPFGGIVLPHGPRPSRSPVDGQPEPVPAGPYMEGGSGGLWRLPGGLLDTDPSGWENFADADHPLNRFVEEGLTQINCSPMSGFGSVHCGKFYTIQPPPGLNHLRGSRRSYTLTRSSYDGTAVDTFPLFGGLAAASSFKGVLYVVADALSNGNEDGDTDQCEETGCGDDVGGGDLLCGPCPEGEEPTITVSDGIWGGSPAEHPGCPPGGGGFADRVFLLTGTACDPSPPCIDTVSGAIIQPGIQSIIWHPEVAVLLCGPPSAPDPNPCVIRSIDDPNKCAPYQPGLPAANCANFVLLGADYLVCDNVAEPFDIGVIEVVSNRYCKTYYQVSGDCDIVNYDITFPPEGGGTI